MNKYYLTRQLRTLLMLCKLCVLFIFLVLAACGHHDKYVQQLNEANQRQKGDSLFTEVNEMKSLVDYFSRHGSANERMLAHYLLGRAYADSGEAPMAIDCYLKAVECADTTQTDCDYGQLSRIFGQMADFFYSQNLYHSQLKCLDKSIIYGYRANDTINALRSYESKASAYDMLGMNDSIIYVAEDVCSKYRKLGLYNYAATSLGISIIPLLKKKKYAKAKHYIDTYRYGSGHFDKNNNIESGREIFYHTIGEYFLAIDENDSAEFYFRKELRYGKDFNNQNAASYGLARLFQKKCMPDSVAKYAFYSYDMNDSLYTHLNYDVVERLKNMYNYSHYKDIATKEQSKSERKSKIIWITIAGFIIAIMLCYIIINILHNKYKEQLFNFQNALESLERMQSDVMSLRLHEKTYQSKIKEKEKQIIKLQNNLSHYQNNKHIGLTEIENELKEQDIYKRITELSIKGIKPTEEDWRQVRLLVIKTLPNFNKLLASKEYALNINEFNTCVLIRLHIRPLDISHMLGISAPAVSKIRENLLYKIFGIEGKAKEFDERILQLS